MNFIKHKTPIGYLYISENNGEITDISVKEADAHGTKASTPVLKQAAKELDEYFSGARTHFDLPLDPSGTDFQKKIWIQMAKIPYGTAINYGELARRAGSPQGARAAGGACNKNPILIVLPCHRVIGKDGSLTGFGSGLDLKEKLLKLEGIL